MPAFSDAFSSAFSTDQNPALVPAPRPGDPDYVDHIADMLARLPEQFKEKRE